MNINSAFPSKYIKASDLGDAQPVVTISKVAIEGVGQNKEMRPIVYFEGKEKGLVLNKTNGNKITELLGTHETDEWVGCKIRLYASETSYQGDTVECIRVKAATAAKPKPAPVVEDEDGEEIPF